VTETHDPTGDPVTIQPIQLTSIGDAATLLSADACGCGGGSCAVGSAPATAGVAASGDRDILVEGMTCDHCVRAVTEELSGVDGVDAVSVNLVVGGSSRIHLRTSAPVDDIAVRAAVEEAGYQLA
jgi:copper chaperone CopZ